jgi:type VI secretion system protein ImpE
MQRAQELYREGKLTEAISSLQAYLRDFPSERRARIFLFELLCFAGEFDRARKQIAVLTEDSNDTKLGAAFYIAALSGETERQSWYEEASAAERSNGEEQVVRGTWNGQRFAGIRDLDSRLGGSLEFLAAGKYHRIAFRNLKRIEMMAPVRVRDLYWRTANLEMSEDLGSSDLESILIPVLYPHTFLFDDDRTRLGRTTDYALSETGVEIPCGQRMLVIGEDQVPVLAIESIEFDSPGAQDAVTHE